MLLMSLLWLAEPQPGLRISVLLTCFSAWCRYALPDVSLPEGHSTWQALVILSSGCQRPLHCALAATVAETASCASSSMYNARSLHCRLLLSAWRRQAQAAEVQLHTEQSLGRAAATAVVCCRSIRMLQHSDSAITLHACVVGMCFLLGGAKHKQQKSGLCCLWWATDAAVYLHQHTYCKRAHTLRPISHLILVF